MSKEFFSTGGSHNTIAHATQINGDVTAEADLRIDGNIIGNIICQGKVIIGPKGSVTGNISAESAEVLGMITGDLKVKESLSIKATAQVNGNIEMRTLSIEPHAMLTGYCTMIS